MEPQDKVQILRLVLQKLVRFTGMLLGRLYPSGKGNGKASSWAIPRTGGYRCNLVNTPSGVRHLLRILNDQTQK